MKRETNRRTIEQLLATIGAQAPDATIRVSLMIGFPGETEAEFEELLEFVAANRFDRLGGFVFSAEEGTRAAAMPDQVAEEVKLERLDRLMVVQQEIAFDKNNSLIGNTLDVIIDSVAPNGSATGRTRGDCPDIDPVVRVEGSRPRVGEIYAVRIEAADGYDLVGKTGRE
jgi:ribosomal protein S12 methylthiotransferase